MPIYKKEDILGIMIENSIHCADCYNDEMITKDSEFILEENLQGHYFICDDCGKCL